MLRTLVARIYSMHAEQELPMPIVPCVTVALLFGATPDEQDYGVTVVWLRGEHDASTARYLSEAIRRAVDVDDADVMLDLRDVTFMSCATVGVIVKAKTLCKARSLTLRVRRPSRCARRLLDLCSLNTLILDDDCVTTERPTALRSWVAVPTLTREADRVGEPSDEHVPATILTSPPDERDVSVGDVVLL
jgi:anti-anti-sigma factor